MPPARRGAWASGLIVALFIALASALLPGAMPASQMVGSAFNPATTQVALSRDESEQTVFAAPHENRQRTPLTGGGTDLLAVMATPATVAATILSSVAAVLPVADDSPSRPAFVRPGAGPRAPPVPA